MNFESLEVTLPNGFHDARLKSISINYELRNIDLKVDLLTGTPDSKSKIEREGFRSAEIKITNFDFCIVDPPDEKYTFDKAVPLSIDAGPGQPSKSIIKLPKIKSNNFLFWIWVNDWNAFIRISAADMQMKYTS